MEMRHIYATEEDFRECSRIHRRLGTTVYFASRRLPAEMKQKVDAVFAFVRTATEGPIIETRQQLLAAGYGKRPERASIRAFSDVMSKTQMPLDVPLRFIDAFDAPIGFETYVELQAHIRVSSGSLAEMLLHVLGEHENKPLREAGLALAEAMRLTNILRNVGQDAAAGHIYFPRAEMAQHGVTEASLRHGIADKGFVELMRLTMSRARILYRQSDQGIALMGEEIRFGAALAREVYENLLDKIDEIGYDVFRVRVHATPQEKMVAAWTLWGGDEA